MRTVFMLFLFATPLTAAEPRVLKDVPYAPPENPRQVLDVYAPPTGENHPTVFYIHGGGWKRGDKGSVGRKPQVFTDRGFVLVSTNYRFVPNVTIPEMTGDIAKSIRWVHDHAKEFGGDPNRIIVMGHSAGAHLAALVCTDERYLKAEGLSLANLKGCVPVDVSMYDIPKRVKDGGSVPVALIEELFGKTEAAQKNVSPAAHATKGKNIPAFLILHVAERPDTKAQSEHFASALSAAGVSAKVIPAVGKTHGSINADLGLPDDKPTKALYEFLDAVLKK